MRLRATRLTAIAHPARGLRLTDLAAAIRALFAAGEQGVWYDPSDLTTLFQDAAGTIPVTAVEQPVGLMLDKSGRNNHATQSTSTNRPVLSGRYNLLTKTERFDDGVWTKNQGTITANATFAPDGTLTADRLTASGTSSFLFQAISGMANTAHVYSVAVLKGTSFTIAVDDGINTGRGVTFDGVTGQFVTLNTLGAGYSVSSYSCVTHPLDSGYWLASMTTLTKAGKNNVSIWINTAKLSSYAEAPLSTPGDTLTVWGADLRVANDGVGLPAYQRVNTSTDYDTTGFPLYLSFNGSNQWMQTNAINFTATDKMFVFAGARKLSDAAQAVVAELSASIASNNGAFLLAAPDGATQTYGWDSKGTLQVDAVASSLPAPRTNVLAALADIAGDNASIRVNGAAADTDAGDQGTGYYGNYAMFIGARDGTALWFNGRLYQLVVRGAQSTEQQIIDAETYINSKTKAYA